MSSKTYLLEVLEDPEHPEKSRTYRAREDYVLQNKVLDDLIEDLNLQYQMRNVSFGPASPPREEEKEEYYSNTIPVNLTYDQLNLLVSFQKALAKEELAKKGEDVSEYANIPPLGNFSFEELKDVMLSANYLDNPTVVERAAKEILNKIKDFSVEELRDFFEVEIGPDVVNSPEYQESLAFVEETNRVLANAEPIKPTLI